MTSTDTTATVNTRGTVILVVLGGSSFMGRILVHTALRDDCVACVMTLNRGNVYWSSDLCGEEDAAATDRLRHIFFDRSDSTDAAIARSAAELHAHLQHMTLRTASVVVVDFSCDDADYASTGLRLLSSVGLGVAASHLKKYILISTDSVYALVSPPAPRSRTTLADESWPLRPPTSAKPVRYGDCKAAAERFFAGCFCGSEPVQQRLLVLRLPDVVGPFDNTSRWWATQLWGEAEPTRCYITRSSRTRRISVVYAPDVVRCIMGVVVGNASPNDGCYGVFNVSAPPIRLSGLVEGIIGPGPLLSNIDTSSSSGSSSRTSSSSSSSSTDDCCLFYPSVSIPPLDATKAGHYLGFASTEFESIFRDTRAFFSRDGPAQRRGREWRRALRKLPRWVRTAVRGQEKGARNSS